jgi:hypothetical protein
LTIRPTYVLVLFVTRPADIDDVAMLAEFAQLAMARARAASARAEAVEAEGGDPSVHVAVFDRMGRAMRLALSLRRRFADEAEQRAGRHVQARKQALSAALKPAIRLSSPFADRQDLDWALAHRLETEADTLAMMPFEAGLAHLVRLLGLPDEIPIPPSAEDWLGEDPLGGDAQRAPDGVPAPDLSDLLTPDLGDRALRVAARATGPP